jgi:hypothetical protein
MNYGVVELPDGTFHVAFRSESAIKKLKTFTLRTRGDVHELWHVLNEYCQGNGQSNGNRQSPPSPSHVDTTQPTAKEQHLQQVMRNYRQARGEWPHFGVLINEWLIANSKDPDDYSERRRVGGFLDNAWRRGVVNRDSSTDIFSL